MSRLLHKFEHPWQAEIFQELLANEGIRSYIIKGAREYVTILTGIGQPPTELVVDDNDYASAQKYLSDYLRKSKLQLVEEEPATVALPEPKNHFNYVIFLSALGAVLIPVIFNVLATYHLVLLWREQNAPNGKKILASAVAAAGWAATLFILKIFAIK
jgi:hypothetical protein